MSNRNTLDDGPGPLPRWWWVKLPFYFVIALTLTIYDSLKRKVRHE